MDETLRAIVATPEVIRALPRLLPECGLTLHDMWRDVVREAGDADFLASMMESCAPMAVRADLPGAAAAEAWLDRFRAPAR